MSPPDKSREKTALLAGVACFVTWGLIPGYWKLLKTIPAIEILAHRYLWTTIFLFCLLTWQRRWDEVKANLHKKRALLFCLASGLTISINWFLFIWAVNDGRIIETSLGYYMTPLINVLFGAIFLRERLTRLQIVSVALASSAVLYMTFGYGQFPWVAVALCVSFGFYGLLRKKSGTAAIPGLFFETTLIVPIALASLILRHVHGTLYFGHVGWKLTTLLISTGFVTAIPLVWFGYATQHLRLVTIGFLQYLAPTGSFLLGVLAYHEPFTRAHLVTFSLIWLALIIFTGEAIFRWRSARIREALEESVCGPV